MVLFDNGKCEDCVHSKSRPISGQSGKLVERSQEGLAPVFNPLHASSEEMGMPAA